MTLSELPAVDIVFIFLFVVVGPASAYLGAKLFQKRETRLYKQRYKERTGRDYDEEMERLTGVKLKTGKR